MLFRLLLLFLIFFFSCNDKGKTPASSNYDIDKIKFEASQSYERNDYRNAIILYNDLIKTDTTQGEYYFKRGYSYSMLFDVEDAVQDYLKAIELGYRVAHSYNNIGVNYSTINDSLAIVYFRKSLELDRNNAMILKRVRDCQQRLNDVDKQFLK